jgi:Phage portal protein
MPDLLDIYAQPKAVAVRPISEGEVQMAGQVLFGPDGKPLPPRAFQGNLIDAGPGDPLVPRLPGVVPPREFQYPIGFNLIPGPRTEDTNRTRAFTILRALSYACPYPRIAINHRKNQIAAMHWDIVVKKDGKSKTLRDEYKEEIENIKSFFRKPNRLDNMAFAQWLKQAIEEILVTDALVFYLLPTRSGGLHSFVQIDGATIKPIIDEFGHIIAHQQILYGFPATGYLQFDAAGETMTPGTIVYQVFNPKVDSIYGTPPMEEILPIIQLGISRINYQVAWYTDGTTPDGFIEGPPGVEASKLREHQQLLDDLFSGNDRRRHKVRFLPSGSKFQQVTKGLNYNKDEEEMLISAVCGHFGVSRSIFVAQVNRATAETMRDEEQDVGFKPLKIFLKDFFDDIISGPLDAPELEFQWVDQPAGNEKEIAMARALSVGNAAWRTPNELRAEDGLDPLPSPEPSLPAAPSAPGVAAGAPAGTTTPAPKKPGAPGAAASPEQEEKLESMKAEIGQWRRFALSRLEKSRHTEPFDASRLPRSVITVIEAGLRKAETAEAIKALFEKADRLATQRDQFRRKLGEAVKRHFAVQRESVLRHAEKLLPRKDEAA